jgi:hypothetical protein
VNAARARKRIRELARQNRYVLTGYCALRLLQRSISGDDVRSVLMAPSGCWPQAGGRWKLEGRDRDGDDLFLIVELMEGLIVVTAFRGAEDEDDEG